MFVVALNRNETNTKGITYVDVVEKGNKYFCPVSWFKNQVDILIKHIDNNKLSFLMGDFSNTALLKDEGYDYIIAQGMIDTYKIAEEKDSGITVKGTIDGWKGCRW